ncbi:MAG: 6-bladed beta-propeller [Magnetococcales bacterium]|nr:6-bladed beta-propeller [Magnetococcales bacterium]
MMAGFSLRMLFGVMALSGALLTGGCVEQKQAKTLDALVFPSPPDQARFQFERTIRSNFDVEPKDKKSMAMMEMLTGNAGLEGGKGFSKPYGIAVRKGVIYVSDTVLRTVMRLDPENGNFSEIGKEDPGALAKPMGIALDRQGNLYVMDATKKYVMIYGPDGKYLRAVGGKNFFDRPSSVAVNAEGTKLFVVDTGSAQGKPENHSIRVFDAQTGGHLFDIGKRGDAPGQFNLLRDARISPDGLLYVVDGGNFRIQAFTQEGKFVRTFGSVGRHLGQFARPKGIASDQEGNLYVSDASHGNFQIFNKEGQLLLFVGDRGPETERAKYLLPALIDVDEDGRVYLVDQGYRKVDIYRPAALGEKDGFLGRAFQKLESLKPVKESEKKAGTAAKDKAIGQAPAAPAAPGGPEED